MKRKRSIISLLLIFAIMFYNAFLGKGVEIKADTYSYYNTSICQTVNGVEWTVFGTMAYNDETREWFLKDVTNVQASIDKNANIKEIVIPESIVDGRTKADITKLKANMFKDNTKIESVTLNSKITSIGQECFSGCTNLKSVKAVNNTQAINVESQAFYECSALETVDFVVGDVELYAFNGCENLESITIGGSGQRIIRNSAFSRAGLSEIKFEEGITKIELGSSCFSNTQLKNVTIPCECVLSEGVFKNCTKLQKAEFKGKVTRKELHKMYFESDMYGVFENAFAMEYDTNGKLLEKEVVFHDEVVLQPYEKISSRTRGEFANCSGLTKVTFEGEATIPRWTFYNCMNLEQVNFNAQSGRIKLGGSCFSGCKLKDLHFYTELYCMEDDVLTKYETSPFYKSNVVDLYCVPVEKNGYDVNISADTLENVYFGENASYITGSIYDSRNVKKIVIENPHLRAEERTHSDFSYDGKNNLKDTLSQRHYIVGYSSSDVTLQNVEAWLATYSEKGIFSNMIQGDTLKVSDLKYIGTVKKEDIDFSKLDVTYSSYNNITKEIKVEASVDGTDLDGYIVETKNLPDVLEAVGEENQEYFYPIVLAGEKVFGKIIVEPKRATKLHVNWNEDKIKDLVANQPVTLSDLVSDATVTYNDDEEKSFPLSELNLENTKTVENANTFTVTLKSDANIKDTYTTEISPNYITDIEAIYLDGSGYVGKSIDTNKVKIYPHYKYDEDPQLNRDIVPTKISNNVIMSEGENIIEVSYGDITTELIVCGLKVVPTDMTAYFDSDNYKYIDGQKEIDKNAIKARVNYNDGTFKEIDGNMLDSIEIVSKLSTELGVKVKYQNIESPVFYINATPKQVEKIEVTASVKSAIEGTTLLKNMISQIDVTYNNKVTESLSKEEIDYDKLELKNTEIKANVENNITVEYLGKTDTITIIGIPNTIKEISAIYTGTGVPVGNTVTLDEVKVTAINANGVEKVIENGCLLENAMIYNVGANNVIVHYGEFQCNVEVKGIAAIPTPSTTNTVGSTPAPSVTNTVESTPVPSATDVVQSTIVPSQIVTINPTISPTVSADADLSTTPVINPTDRPSVEVTEKPVELPSNELPGQVAIVTKSAVSICSSVKAVKIAKKKAYTIVTNKKVVITCELEHASDLKYQFVKKGDTIKANKWKTVKKNKISINSTSEQSGILYISYKDYTGKTKKIFTTGFKIDKKKATANVKNNQNYKKGQKITFKDASGIKSAKLDGKNIKSGKKVTKKGKHSLVLVDKAGNKTKINFTIK